MRVREFILAVFVAFFAAGCSKPVVTEGTDMHEFTEEELRKKSLDDAFTVFFEAFKFDSVEDPLSEILTNSRISFPNSPVLSPLRYTYTKDSITLITMDVKFGGYTAYLYGGIRLEGSVLTDGDSAVFIDGEKLATLDIITYDNTPTPVFRFPDGTSYAVTGVLLVEPLLDFLIKYVLSTE